MLDQEIAGIDVVTGGEMHRRTHNRHSPPNAMLNHFWRKIPAFRGSTRPKPITEHDPDIFHPAATCKDRISETIDLGLVDEFKMVSALTKKPVKMTVAERIQAEKWLAPEQTLVTSSCGFNHLSRRVAIGKLQAMAEAKRLLGGSE